MCLRATIGSESEKNKIIKNGRVEGFMFGSFESFDDLLNDPICWEGQWDSPSKECKYPDCLFCLNECGYYYVACRLCKAEVSQCHVYMLYGVGRVRESDFSGGFPVAFACRNCFPRLNETLTRIRMDAMPCMQRALYEPLEKWMLENWGFFQKI